MNIIQKLKLAKEMGDDFDAIQSLNKKGAPLMKYVPIVVSLLITLASALSAPDFVSHHLAVYAVLNGLAQILHAALPSVAPTK